MLGTAHLSQASPQLTTTITVTPVSERVAELTSRDPQTWTGDDLAAFITEEIGRLSGPQLPCTQAESILRKFWERHGAQGVLIARRAFEAHQGFWMGAPVTIRRFGQDQDEFFSWPLLNEISGE